MKKKCAVVIPMYTMDLSEYEEISLKQAEKVFINYDVIAVLPEELVFNKEDDIKVERFEDEYFESVASYNRFVLSEQFYQRFQGYEYILLYQLDAFVFEDKLAYFCNLGYDYIGAPWLHGLFNYVDAAHSIWYVGNGGFSLRKVDSFLNIIREKKPLCNEQIKNEDLYFASILDKEFKQAPKEIALQFAFERQVKTCYQNNHYELPFGCHAWERYDFEFWKPHLEACGYEPSSIHLKKGNEDEARKEEYMHWQRITDIFENNYNAGIIKQKLCSLFGRSNRGCIIWGAGFYGASIARWFESLKIRIVCFCDNDWNLAGKTLHNYPIIHTSEIQSNHDELIVISNYEYEHEIEEQLIKMNDKAFILFSKLAEILK